MKERIYYFFSFINLKGNETSKNASEVLKILRKEANSTSQFLYLAENGNWILNHMSPLWKLFGSSRMWQNFLYCFESFLSTLKFQFSWVTISIRLHSAVHMTLWIIHCTNDKSEFSVQKFEVIFKTFSLSLNTLLKTTKKKIF